SSKMEDFGTALFYMEELLKNGFTDKATLYSLEHTALLRITPEFNELVTKYLDDARYGIKE
ncbi:MAG: alpha/beta hydrolase, partial [Flavobacteriales bacterium]